MKLLITAQFILLISCGSGENHQFRFSESLWKRSIPEEYSYKYRLSCFCDQEATDPYIVTIKNNELISLKRIINEGGISVDVDLNSRRAKSVRIEYIFNEIEKATKEKAETIRTKFNIKYGFPESLYIDYHASWADDEFSINVTEFKVISGAEIKF
jgi:hypothetical protein